MGKKFKLVYSVNALKFLKKSEKLVSKMIVNKMDYFLNLDNPLGKAKKLKNISGKDLFRYRIGDFRVVFYLKDGANLVVLNVIRIAHRKDVYKKAHDLRS